MYVLEWSTVSVLIRRLFWYLFPELQSNDGNIYQNNTQVNAEAVRHKSTYVILFLTWHNKSINDNKNADFYTWCKCLIRLVFILLMMSQFIADDVLMTRQLWYDHMNSDN